ncbi:AraC family transcriptional regulator [Thauera sp. CAU 1555]|uniref:AraC family transcriptional regulator n=1 Tax=Thauera sedimentorum TaxID=2767595 RepID=A0ABR9BCA0_9RHOO|nr:AraC family transcriptional regulator [Thauera sedimentorum]MBC9073050.1 AraC family transcriptional regulator [Thauera sedimentorum]MBD8503969.1 AraC family transcriptional regulator [Thauera sedimentorum]
MHENLGARSATLPIRFVGDLLLRLGDERRTRALACMQRAGIAPALLQQDTARVTVEQFAHVYRLLAVELDDETPGYFSRPLRGGTLKFLCLGMLDAANLRVAMHRFCWFFRLVIDDMHFVMSQEGALTRIALVEHVALGPARELILETMLMLVQGVASWMVDRRIAFARLDLAYPPPPYAAEYMHIYPAPAHFNAPVTAFHLDSALLDAPIRQDKAALSAFLRNAPTDWIYVTGGKRLMTHRVRELLEAQLADAPTVEDVARALHISPRTLARHLAQEGTGFQAVKDALRRDIAIARISRTDQPIATIGASLGFDDPATFNRAFKQWTGSPPGAYRKRRAAGADNPRPR